MKILLHSPVSTVRRNGNRQTSSEWEKILVGAGHEVRSIGHYEGESADLLVALHAVKSREAVLGYRETNPTGKVILALSGTDIYPEPSEEARDTMARSDVLITLQRKAVEQIPVELQDRAVPVIQASECLAPKPDLSNHPFSACVVGHLRDVKDPLLAAKASRLLPKDSAMQIHHAGGILEEHYARLVAKEEKENPRYVWLGELSEYDIAKLIAGSRLLILTSLSEGGARVVGEAIAHGTPVLSTRIDGVMGLLGEDYPGFFPVGDAEALAKLMTHCEFDPEFYEHLRSEALRHADQFHPAREKASLLATVDLAMQD